MDGRQMRVSVKLHGGVGGHRRRPGSGSFEVSLPSGHTAADLLSELAARFGSPFSDIAASDDPRLPRSVRLFADGALLVDRAQPLVQPGAEHAAVTIVLMSPVAGG